MRGTVTLDDTRPALADFGARDSARNVLSSRTRASKFAAFDHR